MTSPDHSGIARRINERIRAGEFSLASDETPFLCECAEGCHAVVWLTPDEYDALTTSGLPVRSDAPTPLERQGVGSGGADALMVAR